MIESIGLESTVLESERVQKLLEDVQRTLRDNKLFIQKLKEDDADESGEEGTAAYVKAAEEDFEEL